MSGKRESKTKHIKTECPNCDGYGEAQCGPDELEKCEACGGNGIGRYYYNMIKNVSSPATVYNHERYIKDFALWVGVDNVQYLAIDGVFQGSIKDLRKKIQDYLLLELRQKRKLGYQTQYGIFDTIKRFYESNEETVGKLPWKKIGDEYIRHPEDTSRIELHPYSPEQIKRLYDASNLKYKAFIALLYSTGLRIGAVHELTHGAARVKGKDKQHFLKIIDLKLATEGFTDEELRDFKLSCPDYTDVFRITAYAGQIDSRTGQQLQYHTYCTPECTELINQMLYVRQKAGECGEQNRNKEFNLKLFNPDSPVFTRRFGPEPSRIKFKSKYEKQKVENNRIRLINDPEPLPNDSLRNYIKNIRKSTGIRDELVKIGSRTEIQSVHGFRASHSSQMDLSYMHPSVQNWLEGGDLKGRRKNYVEWPDWKILAEYWKVVPRLTIDKTKYLQATIQEKDKVIHDKQKEISRLDDDRYLWHVKHSVTEQRVDKIENLLVDMFKKQGWALPDKTDMDKPQDDSRLDRIEAMISKLIPPENQPKGQIQRISSLKLKDEKEDRDDTEG